MDYMDIAADLAREEAPVKPVTHFVEDTGRRPTVYRAICGEPIRSREYKRRTSGWPTCPGCKRLLDEYDLQENPF